MASVKKAWIKKYGEEEGLRRWEQLNKRRGITLENNIKRYGKLEGTKKYNSWLSKQKKRGTLNWYINKFGPEEGPIKYKENNSKLSVSTEALKKNGYSDDDIKDIQNRHRENSLHNYDDYIKKYGKEEGKKRYDLMCERKRLHSKRSLDYWLDYHNGDIELAKQSLKEHQTYDRVYFIRKYGEISGNEKYNAYCKSRGQTIENYIKKYGKSLGEEKYKSYRESQKGKGGLEYYIKKYGKVDGEKRYAKSVKSKAIGSINKGGFLKKSYSIGQLELEQYVKDIYKKTIYGNDNPYPIFVINENIEQKYIVPDIVLKDEKIIIEYFGDYWHCNPKIYKSGDIIKFSHNKSVLVDDIWEKDNIKKQILEGMGFQHIVIWEKDWKDNKESIKKELQELLK